MRKDYVVAGHRFSIVMDDASPLWERMRVNYGPFVAETPARNGGSPVFTLNVDAASEWTPSRWAGP